MSLIQLDGAHGGGQLLRTALSLSLITGKAFTMSNIRGARPKPGLMRQHLTCVLAAQELGSAKVDGATIGSQELTFQPGPIRAGDFHFSIGTGGSTTLVLQTLLPAMFHAPAPSTVRIEGGTHNPMAPPFEFVTQCFLPALKLMGVKANVTLERAGFMQTGGGSIFAEVQPVKKWKKLNLTERGTFQENFGIVLNAHLNNGITDREIRTAARSLAWDPALIQLQQRTDSTGPGNIVMLGVRHENVTEISSSVAQVARSAESVADTAAKGLQTYLTSTAPVSIHLADQLLIPLALAGCGKFATFALSKHTQSNMALIPQFLEVRFDVADRGRGVKEISVLKA